MNVEYHLLGPVEAVAGGRPLPLGGRRQRALLALLLLDPGRPLAAGRIAEELWQGAPPAGAEATLRTYVSRLRRALGPKAVVARDGGYAVVATGEQIDASTFEQLLRQGREALGRGAAGLAAERLAAALALWHGPALDGAADGGALEAAARRLDELRLVAREELVEAELALGRHATLVPELQALVHEEPLRERLRRQLVLALHRSGRSADALAAYQEARRLLDEELGLEPGEELKGLERAILRQEVEPVAPVEHRHNLPAPTTSFVGREHDVDEVAQRLREHRLVTLTGMGGAGKTRLALEVGLRQLEAWAGGVWLVDLTALADAQLVAAAVAEVLGADDLLADVRSRELLLVLDNCEHLAAAAAQLAEELLAAAPSVRVLATSRIPLGVPGELDYALDPLPEPAAVLLFLERARAVRRDLAADEEAVAAICVELDGLPLAIELAAARAKALSLPEIRVRLDDRFRFLRAWQRVADPRHQTLQTTMDWSYELLTPEEQQLLRRLAVFAGGADLDAVAAVCVGGDDASAVELLGRLVDASLVRAASGARTRYLLLETVRQYAAARLAEDAAAAAIRRRHAEHYLEVAERANLSIEAIGRGPQDHETVLREQHNLRAAADWAAAADVELGLQLMLALENFWITQGPAEGARRYEQLLAQAGDVSLLLRARATRDYAACLDVQQDFAAARVQYELSGSLARLAGDESGVATATFRLGVIAWHEEGPAETRRLWEESLAAFRALDDRVGELQVLGNLGGLEVACGDPVRGREMIEAALRRAQEIGWYWWEARAHVDLATLAVDEGRTDDAELHARAVLRFAWRTANRQEALQALAILARAAAARGDADRALALWSSVEAAEEGHGRFGRFDRAAYAAAMPTAPWPTPLPFDEAVALALS